MKRLATVIAAIALFGTPAFAADMAVKAPPMAVKAPPPGPIYNWTGFYWGLNVGGGFGRAGADVNYFAVVPPPPFPGSTFCGVTGSVLGSALCINGANRVDMNGPIGGTQAGYNWQSGNYLLGLEADFQGTGQSGRSNFTTNFSNGVIINGVGHGTATISLTERIPWLGTVRGRVGYVANQWLFYATGGLAYGRIEVDSSASASGAAFPLSGGGVLGTPTCNAPVAMPGTCPVWNFNGNGVTRIGWTIGAGAELALGGNWTAKFEYLFVDLGSFDTTFAGLSGCFGVVFNSANFSCVHEAAGGGTIHSTVTDNIVRVGVNYRFY